MQCYVFVSGIESAALLQTGRSADGKLSAPHARLKIRRSWFRC